MSGSSARLWWRGARPRTLGLGVVPVLVGVAASGHVVVWRLVAALIVAAGLQIGVNFANDYFDGVRGVDTAERIGPQRLVASGAVSPRAVLTAALICLGLAAASGLALALATTPALILVVGALALGAALLYSGGPRPYAGLGLGELMVFLFFGLMATCGSAYVMVETVPSAAWWGAVVMGLFAVAVLVANNLRDISTDEAGGKRTLAVRLGDRRTRTWYRCCVIGAFVTIVIGVVAFIVDESIGLPQWGLFGLIAWPLAIRPLERIRTATGRDLIAVLTGTAALHATCGLALALGLALSHMDFAVRVVPAT